MIRTTNAQKRRNIKSNKGERLSNIYRQTYKNYTRLLTRDYENLKILGRGYTDP
jgi:hypothetical protein